MKKTNIFLGLMLIIIAAFNICLMAEGIITIQEEMRNYLEQQNKRSNDVSANDIELKFDQSCYDRDTGDISWDSEADYNEAETTYISVSVLDHTHFVVAYQDVGNSNYGTAIVGTISSTVISYGSEYVFNTASTSDISVSAFDATEFIVSYQDNGNSQSGTAIVGTVSGTIISYGSEYVFNDAPTSYTGNATIDDVNFVITYKDEGNSLFGTAITGSVSGTTITYGSEYVFNSANTNYISISTLDPTNFVVAYQDAGISNYGTAIVGTISGTTISYGSEYVFNNAVSYYCPVSSLDDSHFIVAYRDDGEGYIGNALTGTITNGNEISYSTESTFNNGMTAFYMSSACFHNPEGEVKIVVAYEDFSHSQYGSAIIGTVESSLPPVTPTNVLIVINGNDIELSWDDMSSTSYNIYRSTDPYSQDWGIPIGTSVPNSYIDEGAALNVSYYYHITAEN